MKKLKKLIRLCWFILLLILAVSGIAITGVAPAQAKNRERIIDNEPLIEMVDKKKEENEEKP
ncbi:MAG: hypothetical protein AAGC65_19820 [Mucilaginibacter sp.]|uniref:hypothetical protein n=1 Tax=Mucilaginibacter sp. TaxID=1882438 RepID=UPI0031A884F8